MTNERHLRDDEPRLADDQSELGVEDPGQPGGFKI